MAANIIIYCLEDVTDYFEFERLSHDLMALDGFRSIEPLGGFKDKGRDAIHVNTSGETTIFAYSVREDWRAKLAEDAAKIHKHGHTCDRLFFITTARFTAGERDEAVNSIRDEFGWSLELFGVERLRILLEAEHSQVIANHPIIFPPQFFPQETTPVVSIERKHLLISFAPQDSALAEWLSRRLTAEGYDVWCERFKTLSDEPYPDDPDEAIKNRAFAVIALYSRASLQNPEITRQRAIALDVNKEQRHKFLIPINVDGIAPTQLDRITASLDFISFISNWAIGLRELLNKLQAIGCPKSLNNGGRFAIESYFEKRILSDQSETVISNCLPIERIPEVIHRVQAKQDIPKERLEKLQTEWAFRKLDSKMFLSFHQPPLSLVTEFEMKSAGGSVWRHVSTINKIHSRDLVVELVKKSLLVKCYQKGLIHCPETYLNYFPIGLVEKDRLKFLKPDGSKSYVRASGQRTYPKLPESEKYRYYLAPTFTVTQNLFDDFVVLLRVRVRITDAEEKLLSKRASLSRRKHLCKNWWNDEWLNRTLAISQFLAEEEHILIGDKNDELIKINAAPITMTAPQGINEATLDELSFERSELQRAQDDDGLIEEVEEVKDEDVDDE